MTTIRQLRDCMVELLEARARRERRLTVQVHRARNDNAYWLAYWIGVALRGDTFADGLDGLQWIDEHDLDGTLGAR